MRGIFCANPLDVRNVDDAYRREVEAVTLVDPSAAGLLRFEQLVDDQDPDGAVRRIQPAEPRAVGVYRGWMLATPWMWRCETMGGGGLLASLAFV